MDKKNLFRYVTVLVVGIFFFSSQVLAQQKQKKEMSKELRERIIASIKEEELIEFIKEIMRAGQPAAENPMDQSLPGGNEEGVSLAVAEKMRASGIDVQLHSEIAGRPNVVGIVKGSGGTFFSIE